MELKIENRRYLGSKTKLIDNINNLVKDENLDINSFADLFGGTGVVAYNFYLKSKNIIINDILESNYYSYLTFFEPKKINLKKVNDLVFKFNNIKNAGDNYFSDNFKDTYVSYEDSKKIGTIRELIEKEFNNKKININEKAYLITSLLYGIDRIANTVGHYDAYIKGKKIENCFVMPNLGIAKTNSKVKIYKENANNLVKSIYSDLIYIDPPYNSRQYSDAYHLLENLARWEKPKVFGVAKKYKRISTKSKYSTKEALSEFSDLINNIKAKYVLMSYNNTASNGSARSQSKLNDRDILNILSKKGYTKVFEYDFKQFNTGKTKKQIHKERLFLCYVGLKQKNDIRVEKIKESLDYVKSPLNYTGGKFKQLDQLKPFLNEATRIIDLFGGGFNVGANFRADEVVYNDKNKQLTNLLKYIYKNDSFEIINKIESLILKYGLSNSKKNGYEYYFTNSDSGLGKYNKLGFLKARNEYNKLDESEIKDLHLLLLIIFSFNNQIRFNSKGEFNIPVGKRDFNALIVKNLINFSNRIKSKDIKFSSLDFEKVALGENDKTVIYCDPPYLLGTATYNETNGWNQHDEKRLYSYLTELSRKGYKFVLSNFSVHNGKTNNLLIDWIKNNDLKVTKVNSNYSNSNYQKKINNAETIEIIVSNF